MIRRHEPGFIGLLNEGGKGSCCIGLHHLSPEVAWYQAKFSIYLWLRDLLDHVIPILLGFLCDFEVLGLDIIHGMYI